jgi:D-glycero-beta-D-manno-heptose 1-phosphate adenylyltransferase
VSWEELPSWRAEMRARGKTLVVTNGCFDLLHLGHVNCLEAARNPGVALLVGVSGDHSVRALKGAGRPVNNEQDRTAVLAGLESVDAVCIFSDKTALRFLSVARPDICTKDGDYVLETLNQDERHVVEQAGGRIIILPFVPGKSTTDILQKLSQCD